jgi:hypothetical protein
MMDPDSITAIATTAILAVTGLGVTKMVLQARAQRTTVPKALSEVTEARLARIEQAVDAIAVEVERISEGQRFTTKLLSERSRDAASAAMPGSARPPHA